MLDMMEFKMQPLIVITTGHEISGPLFEMPYGTAFFAAGFEKRASGYVDTPDALDYFRGFIYKL